MTKRKRAAARRRTKRQVVVIHGGESFRTHAAYLSFLRRLRLDFSRYRAPKSGWKGTLGAALGRPFEVIQPSMPNKLNARYAEWKIWFRKFIPHLNREVVLVGHSLGGLFLAKYLSEKYFPRRIRATLLVAPAGSEGDFRLPKNLTLLERQGGKIFLYQSEDDRIVPFKSLLWYQKRLPGATVRIFRNRGHFNQATFPELARDIRNLYQ